MLSQRPVWLQLLIGFGVGLAGQLSIALGAPAAGLDGPIVEILAPAVLGLIAGLAARGGWGIVGVAVGLVVAVAVLPSISSTAARPETIDIVVAVGAALLGYATGFGVTQQGSANDFMPRPPAPADAARMETEVRGLLRGIDPHAPGAFERATVLLRTVNEQAGMYGLWAGPRPAGEPVGPPGGLLELQAELVETARLAAIAAGARRVTITASGGGLDVQAVFGDPIGIDEPALPVPAGLD